MLLLVLMSEVRFLIRDWGIKKEETDLPKALEKKPVKRTPKASEQILINKAVDLEVKEAVGDVLESIGPAKFTCTIRCRLLR